MGECKPCKAGRDKKGYQYYSTEQQARIARARENGEEVNVTVARTIKPAKEHVHSKRSASNGTSS